VDLALRQVLRLELALEQEGGAADAAVARLTAERNQVRWHGMLRSSQKALPYRLLAAVMWVKKVILGTSC
jgi:hypothetical protein